MAHPRLVVVPKPLDSVPRPLPAGATDPGHVSDPDWLPIARRLAAARLEHTSTIDAVRSALAERDVDAVWLEAPSAEAIAGAALVITVGGDGTFLWAARFAGRVPMLGVNSSPSTSVGHYCVASAMTFPSTLDAVLASLSQSIEAAIAGRAGASEAAAPGEVGGAHLHALTRIRAEIGGVALPFEALNDILFANRVPVASTRYGLHIGPTSELQLSSGIWIATATGSTAAIHSAGGTLMALDDARLQWKVREPYVRRAERLVLDAGLTESPIEILSRSDKNALFIDGQSEPWFVPFGTRARITRSPEPLLAFLP